MSQVFLAAARRSDPPERIEAAVEALWRHARLGEAFGARDLTALKLHVGEPGTTTFVSPAIARALVRLVASTGAAPFLTDTAVLYRSPRDNAVGHARVAHEHGFGLDVVGAPFVAADGLNGADEIEVRVDGRHFASVHVASAIQHARSLLVLSHATGHLGTGYGGALKNLGMGCASKKAKLRQHHGAQPKIDPKKCLGCGTCAAWCPADAIAVERTAAIDPERCIGCGECIAACRDGAVRFGWAIAGRELQERIVEHAAAVVRAKPGRIAYVTAAMAITKDCDCMGLDQPPVLDDIGLLASRDPVAIDQAVLTLVHDRAGSSLESRCYPETDAGAQIRHAVALGLGEARFELVEVTP
ncbi:MAG: DUF362 domain-containing protein [Deltaproteobacteria bacterium]|nr:DUF362 domain-containing protein [Deltaproteobacteria bacterium]